MVLKFETDLKIELCKCTRSFRGILNCKRKYHRVDVFVLGFFFLQDSILRFGLRSTPATPQYSSCLKIDHFREMVTGSVNLGQLFYQNC